MRHLLTLMEYKPHEVEYLLRMSRDFKTRYLAGEVYTPLFPGRIVVLYFEKPSTRTRLSLSAAAAQLGMQPMTTSPNELQMGRGETVADTMRVISRYAAAVAARVYKHETLEEKLGWEVRLVGPKQLWSMKLIDELSEDLAKTGARIYFTDSINETAGVDGVYTDVWVSMGFEREAEERRRLISPYQVNSRVMEIAGKKAVFLHCLPAHRGEEVTDDVIDGPQSAVWDQAENRMHTAKAVFAYLLR